MHYEEYTRYIQVIERCEPRRGLKHCNHAALFEKMITIVNYAIFNASYIFSIREGDNQPKAEIHAAVNKTTGLRQIFREIFPLVLSADDM